MLKRVVYILVILSININVVFAIGKSGDGNGIIKFIENKNQWPASIIYSADLPSGTLYLKNNAFQYFLYDKEAVANLHFQSHQNQVYENGDEACFDEIEIAKHQYLVNFINSNNDVEISGDKPFPEYYNYFIGKNEANWASHVKAYNTVTYQNLYDGIDMQVYSSGDNLKYDLIINPGAESNNIAMEYTGLNDIYIYEENLIIETSLGTVLEQKPYAYQDIEGVCVPVVCNYVLDCGVLSFNFPESYNKSYSVVIDPLLIFSTYSGSNANNWGNTATPGERGTLYSGGIANHFRRTEFLGEFPATNNALQTEWGGIWDVAIIKYDSTGSRLKYATYLGGSGSEVPHSMIMDNDENLIILGSTNSTDFPITSNAYLSNFQGGTLLSSTILGEIFINGSDVFVAKLSKDGDVLKGATYFGGDGNDGQNRTDSPLTRNYGDQQRGEVFIDDENNIYISSVTQSEHLFDDMSISSFDRSYNGGESDGVLVKFNAQLDDVIWGGYLGGSGDDTALAVKVNEDKQVYVAGGTNSADFTASMNGGLQETIQGEEDGFVALIDKDGSQLINFTYLGTSSYDQAYFMDLDEKGDVYVLGQTRGNYPITTGTFNNPGGGQFIHKLKSDLSTTMFSTAFGTTHRNEPNIALTAFLVSDCDNIYVTGWGNTGGNFEGRNYMRLSTRGLPVTSDAIRTTTDGVDFYLMVLNTDAKELLYATFFGGSSASVHVDGGTSRFDKQGIVYHSVCASCDGSSTFPTSNGAWSNQNGSVGCNNAAFKFDLASLKARIQTNTIQLDNPGVNTLCFPSPIVFENASIGGENFLWDFGDNTSEQSTQKGVIVHEYENPGRYVVTLSALDENTCLKIDVAKVTMNIFKSGFSVIDDNDICEGSEFRLEAFGGTSYFWYNSDLSFTSMEQFPTVVPSETTKYYVEITDVNKRCELFDSVTVNVVPAVLVDFDISQNYDCIKTHKIEFVNLTENAKEYTWIFGDGAISTDFTPNHDYEKGVYQLTLQAENEICHDEKTLTVNTQPIVTYNVITPGFKDGANDVFEVQSPIPVQLVIFNRWGKTIFESEDYQNDWDAEGEPSGIYYYDLSVDSEQTCKGWIQVLK